MMLRRRVTGHQDVSEQSGRPRNVDVVRQALDRPDLALLRAEVHLRGGLVEPAPAVNLLVDGDVLRIGVAVKHGVVVQSFAGAWDQVEGLSADDDVRVGVRRDHIRRPQLRRPL